jgi:predicted lactoylglutathione lyase/Zn-finger nucleic acid-binding protein
MTSSLTCPKCAGRMKTYDRSGITIDQCTECRGIYLDRGELPQLIDAEAGYFRTPEADPQIAAPIDQTAHGHVRAQPPETTSDARRRHPMRDIYLNLPVKNVDESREFFTKLGFDYQPTFTDEQCTCMLIEDNIYLMLLGEQRFRSFINDEICDATKATEVVTCLSADSKEQVDETVGLALAAGGTLWQPSMHDGPMYGGSFQDLDGHVWEVLYLGTSARTQAAVAGGG